MHNYSFWCPVVTICGLLTIDGRMDRRMEGWMQDKNRWHKHSWAESSSCANNIVIQVFQWEVPMLVYGHSCVHHNVRNTTGWALWWVMLQVDKYSQKSPAVHKPSSYQWWSTSWALPWKRYYVSYFKASQDLLKGSGSWFKKILYWSVV